MRNIILSFIAGTVFATAINFSAYFFIVQPKKSASDIALEEYQRKIHEEVKRLADRKVELQYYDWASDTKKKNHNDFKKQN